MFLKTEDGFKIAADWQSVKNSRGHLVLIHMMPATKESWFEFANTANEHNYSSIAIDLRGHGQSSGGPQGYKSYYPADHRRSILDIKAAVDFLEKEGTRPVNVIFIGASIGANLALQYIAEHQEFRTAVLLSAGLDYKGINAEKLVEKLNGHQHIFFAAARDDERTLGNNAEQNQKLYNLVPIGVDKRIVIYNKGGHGTNIFQSPERPDLTEAIFDFISR